MDIVDMLRWFRVFKLVSIVTLRKNQAQMVKYFKSYTLQADQSAKCEDGVSVTEGIELDSLMANFDPAQDRTDAILFYLLTGEDREQVMENWIPEDEDGDVEDEDKDKDPNKVADFSIQGSY